MGAKVNCKKGYNTKDGYVEFKKVVEGEFCPASNADHCEQCKAKKFVPEK